MESNGHHGDGEHPPAEALAALGRRCGTCTGLMLTDNHDGDALTCLNCGRSSFCPTPEILAEPPTPAGPVDPVRHHTTAPKRTRAARGMPEGRLVAAGV